jgi:hypothetical protein
MEMIIESLSLFQPCREREKIIFFLQVEIVLQFFTGSVDLSEKYCDNIRVISAVYLSSLSGFWFDCVTSIPWSFNDLYSYQVVFFVIHLHILVVLNCVFRG